MACASAKGGLRYLKRDAMLITVRRLVTILRCEAAAWVSAALLHFADACCAAGVAIPPVSLAGKEPRNFGLHRDKQLAGVPQRTDIIQLPPTTPP
jgi:hypothetical protein